MSEGNDRAGLPAAKLEPTTGNALLRAQEVPRFNTPVNIHVTSYRKRKHDPDGISAKAALDGIVALGILHDDSTNEIKKISYESVIAKKGEPEKTLIEITDEI